ncbi:ATP-dependent DNA helicase RecG [Egicoccus halophilus]|uniref:ATP-dependent DNA helicase RecG n=1 Tax=Egicoccus halophilus TaxID=1670830 RepID=A0A8J3AAM3_9ACTN|nr:ATP-dependent DNA helicase RecG [Egicoccus halophilus]GGI06438.1 ATP-dependent DNA helicase RecG [Egicoccus halophilus]
MSERPLALDDRVDALPGVGAKARGALEESFGIRTVRDLLEHYPRRYQDAGEVLDLAEVRAGEPATLIGEVLTWNTRRIPKRGQRRPLEVAEGTVRQASGRTFTATFFNQNWRAGQLAPGTVAAFSGKVKRFRNELQLASPDVEVLGRVGAGVDTDAAAERLRHQRLLAVYPATEAWPSFKLANLVETALGSLPELPDWLPESLLDELDLVTYDAAVRGIHQPPDHATRTAARRRLVFDELFALQLGVQRRRARLEAEVVGVDNAPVVDGRAQAFVDALPFPPTGAQQRAFAELAQDLGGPRPMHRLLQGDVGSGKTVVAVWTLLNAVDHGRQAAFMVPTEVLAEQHFRTLTNLLAPLGVNVLDGLRIELLTSSTTKRERQRILGELLAGQLDVLVGTHALLEEGVRFADLGVVVIDEQHRFGVAQRVRLKEKAGGPSLDPDAPDVLPDVLVMTATPIPRSLALTVYGDLDVTVLDELPPGREPITTQLITPSQADRRARLYEFVRREAAAGRRAYVVCPLVEEGELPAKDVTGEHRRLAGEVFPELTVELIHGRLRPDAKEAAMRRFRSGEAQVLVATTVIEVGVDVPEATIMVIEDAERFGISQLHQLRGRVGRGGGQSYCVLFAGWSGPELPEQSLERLEAVAATNDGFALAEKDLALRGTGTLFGRTQSGAMSDIRLADIVGDRPLIEETRRRAREVVSRDPDLQAPANRPLRDEVTRRFEGRGTEVVEVDDTDELAAFAALETG